ncbi:hypothetical protein BZA70DRAFT_277439 [Myxozyma melibiosi]|uniref:Uncharacterized protein n=1 Tax=Myxozyma melibiosi TaxID=54550 RepID=A0ABR1F7U0_9ASCO
MEDDKPQSTTFPAFAEQTDAELNGFYRERMRLEQKSQSTFGAVGAKPVTSAVDTGAATANPAMQVAGGLADSFGCMQISTMTTTTVGEMRELLPVVNGECLAGLRAHPVRLLTFAWKFGKAATEDSPTPSPSSTTTTPSSSSTTKSPVTKTSPSPSSSTNSPVTQTPAVSDARRNSISPDRATTSSSDDTDASRVPSSTTSRTIGLSFAQEVKVFINMAPRLSPAEKALSSNHHEVCIESRRGICHRYVHYTSNDCYGELFARFQYIAPTARRFSAIQEMGLITDYDPQILLVAFGEPHWPFLVASGFAQRRKVVVVFDLETKAFGQVSYDLRMFLDTLEDVLHCFPRVQHYGGSGSLQQAPETIACDALSPEVISIVQTSSSEKDDSVGLSDLISFLNLYAYASENESQYLPPDRRAMSTDIRATGFAINPPDNPPSVVARVLSPVAGDVGSCAFVVEVLHGALSRTVQLVFQTRESQKKHVARQFRIRSLVNFEGNQIAALSCGEMAIVELEDARNEFDAEFLNSQSELFIVELNDAVQSPTRRLMKSIDPERLIIQFNFRSLHASVLASYYSRIPFRPNTEVAILNGGKMWYACVAAFEDPANNGMLLVQFLLSRTPPAHRAADFKGVESAQYYPWVGSTVSVKSYAGNDDLWYKGSVFEVIS